MAWAQRTGDDRTPWLRGMIQYSVSIRKLVSCFGVRMPLKELDVPLMERSGPRKKVNVLVKVCVPRCVGEGGRERERERESRGGR